MDNKGEIMTESTKGIDSQGNTTWRNASGLLHRTDGPAFVYWDTHIEEWWFMGNFIKKGPCKGEIITDSGHWQQIKDRLDDFWSLGTRSKDVAITDGIGNAFWGDADNDIHWLLERVQDLEAELDDFVECEESNGCYKSNGFIHSLPPLSFSEPGPIRRVFHKVGE